MEYAKQESVLENNTNKILSDFEIQTDDLIPTTGPEIVLIKKKKNLSSSGFCLSADYRVKMKKKQRKDKYLDLAREPKKLWNMRVTVIPIVNVALGTVTKGSKNTGGAGY